MTTITTMSAAGGTSVQVLSAHTPTAASNMPSSSTVPMFISADEGYYWSVAWQEDVRAAMAARARGESVVFDSDDPNDVARWLLSIDDEDGD